jgi:hypothetical protein
MVIIGCLVLTIAGEATSQQLPPLDGPEPTEQAIEARVKFSINGLATAEDEAGIVQARRQLIRDYPRFESLSFRYQFAAETASRVLALIENVDDQDPLRALRQINGVMAVVAMDQVSIQPALESLVGHDSPAIRLLAWKGYANIRDLILAQGALPSERMFRVLEEQSATETSALVCGAMFEVMVLPSVRPAAVPIEAWPATVEKLRNILSDSWLTYCRSVLAGQEHWPEVTGKAVVAVVRLARLDADNAAAQTKALQMIVDLMSCTRKAYDNADEGSSVANAAIVLLVDCEEALNAVTGITATPVKKAFLDKSIKSKDERGAAVGLAALKWVNDLADRGVVKPDVKPKTDSDDADEGDDGEAEEDAPAETND